MGTLKKDFKYKIIKNFLSKDEINVCKNYLNLRHRINFDDFDEQQMNSTTSDSYWYADPLVETMLIIKRKKMQEETGLELLPTYSFSRLYTYGAVLRKHKDRPECEVSVTVMVGSSGEKWPIYIDGNELDLEPGDAAVYLGCDVEHWRNEFLGDWHMQFFLHYVDKNGLYSNLYGDGRFLLGIQKPSLTNAIKIK
jgi:hypothetical protein